MQIKVFPSESQYIKLSKLRIVELLLVTTVPSMIISIYGMPPIDLIFITLLGGSGLAISANVFNQIIEVDKDMLMSRTADRPLVTGTISIKNATRYGFSLGIPDLIKACLAGFCPVLPVKTCPITTSSIKSFQDRITK